jgi:hypothetical protein
MNIRAFLTWTISLSIHFAFAIDVSAQTWSDVLAPGRVSDAKREAPRTQDLAGCERTVVYPDSLAISGGALQYLDVWKTLGRSGVWDPITAKPSPSDTLRARVIGTECGFFFSPFNLVLQYGPYWLRLRAGAIKDSPPFPNSVFGSGDVFLISDQKGFDPAMWTGGSCDSCSFRVVSAKRFTDSLQKAEASARKIEQDSARDKAQRAAIEQLRLAALANTADSVRAAQRKKLDAKLDAEEARERQRESAEHVAALRRKGWPVAIINAVIAHKIKLGMTREQVRAGWGEPDDIHKTVTAYAVHEQWVYGSQYVYFDDGVVTAWQD